MKYLKTYETFNQEKPNGGFSERNNKKKVGEHTVKKLKELETQLTVAGSVGEEAAKNFKKEGDIDIK